MNRDVIESLIRALMKVGGTALAARGAVTESGWAEITGAVVTIAGVLWGIYSAKQPVPVASSQPVEIKPAGQGDLPR